MRVHIEWGHPKGASGRPCGISAQAISPNPTQGANLANSIFFILTKGLGEVDDAADAFKVSKLEPRKVVWSKDCTAWVAVTLLDGRSSGPYSGIADREHKEKQHGTK